MAPSLRNAIKIQAAALKSCAVAAKLLKRQLGTGWFLGFTGLGMRTQHSSAQPGCRCNSSAHRALSAKGTNMRLACHFVNRIGL